MRFSFCSKLLWDPTLSLLLKMLSRKSDTLSVWRSFLPLWLFIISLNLPCDFVWNLIAMSGMVLEYCCHVWVGVSSCMLNKLAVFKKYVIQNMTFLNPFTPYATAFQFFSPTSFSPVSFNKKWQIMAWNKRRFFKYMAT